MKKVLLLFCAVLSSTWWVKAQQTALEFDGVDDFAFITINQPPTHLGEEITLEAIVNARPNGPSSTILQIPQGSNSIAFGIDGNGGIFVQIGNDYYLNEESSLYDEQCHHVAVTIDYKEINYFLDGQHVGSYPHSSTVVFTNQNQFYLGMSYPNQNTAYMGMIDEVRVWPNIRSHQEINNYAFSTPPSYSYPNFLVLPFLEGSGKKSNDWFDPFNNYAQWMSMEGAGMMWVEPCLPDANIAFKYGNGSPPPCAVNTANPNSLICNGAFEIYHPVLDTPLTSINNSYPPGAPGYAIIPDATGESDVTGWADLLSTGGNTSFCAFFTKCCIGGIPFYNGPSVHPNTYNAPNPANNAMVYLSSGANSGGSIIPGELRNKLMSALVPGQQYEFSGWFYTGTHSPTTNHSGQSLHLWFGTGGQALWNANVNQHLTDYHLVTGNAGWEFITVTFTAPATSYDELYVSVTNPLQTSVISFMDDVELVPYDGIWPQTINTHTNDPTHQRIHVDDSNNVYVAGNIITQTNGNMQASYDDPVSQTNTNPAPHGFYMAKYDSLGNIIWTHLYPYLQMGDFGFAANGDIIFAGWYKVPSPIPTSNPGITLTQQSSTWHWGSNNLVAGRLNHANGNQVFLEGFGNTGIERGVDIEVDAANNKIYIAAEINSANGVSGQVSWGNPVQFSLQSDRILSATYGSTGITMDKFSGGNHGAHLTRIALQGNNLYVLSKEKISRLNTSLVYQNGITLNNFVAPENYPISMVTDGSHVYVSYLGSGQLTPVVSEKNGVIKFNASNLNPVDTIFYNGNTLIDANLVYPIHQPLALTKRNNHLFAAGLKIDRIIKPNDTIYKSHFWVEKIDVSTNTKVWAKESSEDSLYVQSYAAPQWFTTGLDMALLGTNKNVFLGDMSPLYNPWQISFDGKTLSGTQIGDLLSFVSIVKDLGSNGQFKKPLEATNFKDDLLIYPQPASNQITIVANSAIKRVVLYGLNGQAFWQSTGRFGDTAELHLPQVPAGMYLMRVETASKTYNRKIILQH